MTSFAGRGLYAVGPSISSSAPRYNPGVPLRDNVTTLAGWLWGDLRAQWCGYLADDLASARPLARYAPHSQEWVAAILCAAAVDAGRDRRPGTWSRTLSGICQVSDVSRESALARWQELNQIDLTRPRVLPQYWRANA